MDGKAGGGGLNRGVEFTISLVCMATTLVLYEAQAPLFAFPETTPGCPEASTPIDKVYVQVTLVLTKMESLDVSHVTIHGPAWVRCGEVPSTDPAAAAAALDHSLTPARQRALLGRIPVSGIEAMAGELMQLRYVEWRRCRLLVSQRGGVHDDEDTMAAPTSPTVSYPVLNPKVADDPKVPNPQPTHIYTALPTQCAVTIKVFMRRDVEVTSGPRTQGEPTALEHASAPAQPHSPAHRTRSLGLQGVVVKRVRLVAWGEGGGVQLQSPRTLSKAAAGWLVPVQQLEQAPPQLA
jgi:hypothetical protein